MDRSPRPASLDQKPLGPTGALLRIAQDLEQGGFAFRDAREMRSILRQLGVHSWPAFAESWNDLGLDVYMADGGSYRRRRFAAFAAADGGITRKAHQPHYQSRDYNPLNGGVQRWFMPVQDNVATNCFTLGILGFCTALFDAASSDAEAPAPTPWHVEMHQFRIEASTDRAGLPTPEGAHRDGVDWVCVLLIGRSNVSSGVTQIFAADGAQLGEFTLTDPLDAVFLDDRRVLHGVTPIAPIDPEKKAWRDVLVLTFRRQEAFSGGASA